MTEDQIKAVQAIRADNGALKKLVSRIYHQTMADEAAASEGTNIFVSPQTVAEMEKFGRGDISTFNPFMAGIREGARPVSYEGALKDLEALRDEMDTVTVLARRLYDHHDISHGSATLGHLSRIFACYVRDATEAFAQSVRDNIDASAAAGPEAS